jgi:amino acid adenylation domain-containing protein
MADGEMAASGQNKRERLAALLRQRAVEAIAEYPLTYGQKALWFLYESDRRSAAYNTAFTARIAGPVDERALRRALEQLTARHASLRSTFSNRTGEVLQQAHGYRDVDFRRHDVSGLTEEEIARTVLEDYRQPFDLERGPVMRVTLFSRSSDDHVLLLAVHHIVCDAWSLWIMVDELTVLWAAAETHEWASLPLPEREYSDFVRWQSELLSSDAGQDLREYWRDQLRADIPVLALPTDRPRPPMRVLAGDSYAFQLPSELLHSLRAVADTHGTTLYVVLLAGFEILLHRYSHQEEFTLGTLTTGRSVPDLAHVVGYFANPVVVRADIRCDIRVSTLLAGVREQILGGLAHQDYPFPLLIQELRPVHDPSRTPFMDVLFVYQKRQSSTLAAGLHGDSHEPSVRALEKRLSPFEIAQMEGQFDLTLEISESGRAVLKYAAGLFDQSRIARMARHFESVLRALAANPAARISSLPFLSAEEREQLVNGWNSTAADYPADRCLHELFEHQAARTPDNVAVKYGDRTMSYRELNCCANALAYELRERGTGPESVVGVCLDRSPELVVALLAVLKAGGAYLPLDPGHPPERLEFMARNAGIRVVLTGAERGSAVVDRLFGCECLPVDQSTLTRDDALTPVTVVQPTNLAYVIYTSGSTGDPKGAMNTHRAICNRLLWMQQAYGLRPHDRVLQKTPFTFDVSVWEFFWPLLNGASIIMARPGGHQDANYLVDTIRKERVTVVHFVPSMLRAFLETPSVQACRSLAHVFCSGETLSVELRDRCHAALSGQLHNLYGPTEAAVDVTAWDCRPNDARPTVPIGRPIANTQIHILDRYFEPVPIGVPGELYIGGENVGRGYVRRPDLTAERFIPNPFGHEPGSRLYRTGDVARHAADGTIEYVGRSDHQVKVRGVRIELAEVEAVVLKHPQVQAAAAAVSAPDSDGPKLVGYFIANGDPPPSTTELRQFLSARLPQTMIPEIFEQLAEFPLTSSGKVDRKRLPAPRLLRPKLDTAFERPSTSVETIIANVWQRVLGVDGIGLYDNFFDLGGHSLRMTQVMALLHEQFDRPLSVVELFQHPTIHSLAELFSGRTPADTAHVDNRVLDRTRHRPRIEESRMARQRHRASKV